jgi:hypothetical protein
MYRVIEAPPHLGLELDVNLLQYRDLQFIHSEEMEYLQDHFYRLEGFIERAHKLKLKRVQELKGKEEEPSNRIPEGVPTKDKKNKIYKWIINMIV